MRCLSTGEAARDEVKEAPVMWMKVLRLYRIARILVVVGGLSTLLTGGCKGGPTLAQQESMVRQDRLVLEQITTRAVVNVWGEPPHHRSEFTQFFVMADLSLIPRTRVPSGEAPRGWTAGVHAGEGVYFAYPDHGWLLVFLNEKLVYKEKLEDEKMEALVNAWAYEDRFKTRLDGLP